MNWNAYLLFLLCNFYASNGLRATLWNAKNTPVERILTLCQTALKGHLQTVWLQERRSWLSLQVV